MVPTTSDDDVLVLVVIGVWRANVCESWQRLQIKVHLWRREIVVVELPYDTVELHTPTLTRPLLNYV